MQGTQDRQAARQPGALLTSAQVGAALGIDQSTVYRMAADGRLRAIKVGRQWRFPATTLDELVGGSAGVVAAPGPAVSAPGSAVDAPGSSLDAPAAAVSAPGSAVPHVTDVPQRDVVPDGLDTAAACTAVAVAAELLGVMMVVTDMAGRALTPVANPCRRFAALADDPSTVAACAAEWRTLADELDLQPRFRPGALGFECARSYVRVGDRLIAMVLAGGLAPEGLDDPDLYHLAPEARAAVLAALPRVAAALSAAGARTR